MRKLLAYCISIYQKKLSQHKGFSCAHKSLHGGYSCSEYTKQEILSQGILLSLKSVKQRFTECSDASSTLRRRNLKYQRGDCDLGLSAADCAFSCGDLFSTNNKKRSNDLWLIAFVIVALVLITFFFVFK